MKIKSAIMTPFPSQLAVLLLASAIGIPALAQDAQTTGTPQSAPPQAAQQTTATPSITPAREGFWGRVNPWARKKWVKKQTDPINDRLTELDALNAKNSKDIQDVDSRAQAGIRQAQSAADAANQTATAAGTQAQQANATAQGAAGHVDELNGTVNGLDQYHQVTEAEITFRHGEPALSADAKKQLDDLATGVNGQHGYILELEAHSPLSGSAGIQSSQRLAEAVDRYLVTQHEIPVYRMHSVALGNAHNMSDDDAKPVRISSVHVRLMENSLAAQGAAPPQGAASSTGADRQ
ncbi:MAG TPA: OmpA family protein [Terracidiphilus sp.]|jgi:outer membrane protein OmpA-like peptidoglycan-associated protein|nr:OmpA family protein [Terracidiphilus sp.]